MFAGILVGMVGVYALHGVDPWLVIVAGVLW
jgi:hypothetical protein